MLMHIILFGIRTFVSVVSITVSAQKDYPYGPGWRRLQTIVKYNELKKSIAEADDKRFGRYTRSVTFALSELLPELLRFGKCEAEIIIATLSPSDGELLRFDHEVMSCASAVEACSIFVYAIKSGRIPRKEPLPYVSPQTSVKFEVDYRVSGDDMLLHLKVDYHELFIRGKKRFLT